MENKEICEIASKKGAILIVDSIEQFSELVIQLIFKILNHRRDVQESHHNNIKWNTKKYFTTSLKKEAQNL